MGRRRQHSHDLPPHMHRKMRGGVPRYYYGRQGIALGTDFAAALRKYAELHAGRPVAGTFAEAVALYEREELPAKAPKTQAEYQRQLGVLVGAFPFRLDAIKPSTVAEFMRERGKKVVDELGKTHGGKIVATREKALLSAVFNFARARGLTDAPNPCSGIRGTKAKRDRYVGDDELRDAIARADAAGDVPLAQFLELCYLTGQRPGDVVRVRRSDAQGGVLHVRQGKTGAKVRIALVGPLAALYDRMTAGAGVASVFVVRNEAGQPLTLGGWRKRFDKLGCDWQIRDLRAKAASDADTARDAQTLLGHAAATTTDGYIRQRAGARATPIMRKVSK